MGGSCTFIIDISFSREWQNVQEFPIFSFFFVEQLAENVFRIAWESHSITTTLNKNQVVIDSSVEILSCW